MTRKFVGLDFLRFGLAIYLMAFHTVTYFPEMPHLPFHELLSVGGMATSSFFLLSGFILAHVYLGQDPSRVRGGTRDFLIKRLTNLYPIHWISLCLFLLVLGVSGLNKYSVMSMIDDGNLPTVALGPLALWFNRALAFLLLDTWNPLYVTLNPPAWSLSVLLFFYLCFPWMGPRLLRAARPVRLLLLIWLAYFIPPVVASVMNWYGAPAAGLITSNPILRLPEFMAGIVFYGLYSRGALRFITDVKGWRVWGVAFVAVNFIAAAWLMAYGPECFQYLLHNGGLMPAQLILILVCAETFSAASERTAQIAGRLGNTALSIFAIHLAVFYTYAKIAKFFGTGISPVECGRHLSACVEAYKATGTPSIASYPIYLVCTVIIALFFQEVVVVKVRDALRRRFLKQRVVAVDTQAPQARPNNVGNSTLTPQ